MEDAGQRYFILRSEVLWTDLWAPTYGRSLMPSSLRQNEAVTSPETYILVYRTTRCHISRNFNLRNLIQE